MPVDETVPELIQSVMRWVEHKATYKGMWMWMRSGSRYSIDDFRQDLLVAWYENKEFELTGDYVDDARGKGMFRVLGKAYYVYRTRYRAGALPPDEILQRVTSDEDEESGSIDHASMTMRSDAARALVPVYRRQVMRKLAMMQTQREIDAIDLPALLVASTPRLGDDDVAAEPAVIARRHWWRLMNLE